MPLISFKIYAIITAALLLIGTVLLAGTFMKIFKSSVLKKSGDISVVLGIAVQAIFIVMLWISLNRPPFRTLGETRTLYTFFFSLIAYITYKRWNYLLIFLYGINMAFVFLALNYFMPENYDKTLMPALQSPWFAPHVIVYIIGYAFLGLSSIFALIALITYYFGTYNDELLPLGDNLVVLGYSFITLGLIFGALWAKEAWGHYWTWDPKETWAFLTWAAYLVYMHIRFYRPQKSVSALWILMLAFVVLLIAWFGLSYLPSAQNSVHIYSNYQ